MLVVNNTSPLTNLAVIGHFDLLHRLFGEVHIAEAVWSELKAGGQPHPGSNEVDASAWVLRRSVENQPLVSALRGDLDSGESETLALAVELRADLVLMDEREGRHAAERLGLKPLGVLGILLRSKEQGLLPTVRPALEALRHEAGFFLGKQLFEAVLEIAGE